MKIREIIITFGCVLIAIALWSFSNTQKSPQDFSETTKISLREIGHQLLLSQQDSSSIVLPIVAIEDTKFQLAFENDLTFDPTNLATIIKDVFEKTALSQNYRVAVLQCSDGEVAYSYEMTTNEATTIIPCGGRLLPKRCYTITVLFLEKAPKNKSSLLYLCIPVLVIFGIYFISRNKKKAIATENSHSHSKIYATIGMFTFYPEEHTLVKEAEAIPLSKKECELLRLFIEQINQVITREELTKKIWEDNGVIVGRSLDTYISKLRKKLKEDTSIKITNVHGVGYKLEVLKNEDRY